MMVSKCRYANLDSLHVYEFKFGLSHTVYTGDGHNFVVLARHASPSCED